MNRLSACARIFCRPDTYLLNNSVLYLRKNEAASHITMVHLHPPGDFGHVELFERNASIVNQLYPKLVIDAVAVRLPSCA